MAIKDIMVTFSRIYGVSVDEKSSEEFIIQKARDKFNNDIQFGLITANKDDFRGEIIID